MDGQRRGERMRVVWPVIEVDEIRHGPDDAAPNGFEPEGRRTWRITMTGDPSSYLTPGQVTRALEAAASAPWIAPAHPWPS